MFIFIKTRTLEFFLVVEKIMIRSELSLIRLFEKKRQICVENSIICFMGKYALGLLLLLLKELSSRNERNRISL